MADDRTKLNGPVGDDNRSETDDSVPTGSRPATALDDPSLRIYEQAHTANDADPVAFRRGVRRTVRGSLKRFLAIVAITALGVSIMCGLRAGCEDLRDSVDAYFDAQNVYDISVQSTLGLTRDDLEAIAGLDGVDVAEGIYAETAYTAVGQTRERVSVQSLSKENIDQPVLVSGSLPEGPGEVAVSTRYLKASGNKIGDTVTFAANDADSANQSGTDIFEQTGYRIVGEVNDPTDIMADESASSFRAASAEDYQFYVSEDSATSSVYTAIHVRVAGADALSAYSSAYQDKVDEVMERIDGIKGDRIKEREHELTVEAPQKLDEAERSAQNIFAMKQRSIDEIEPGSAERAQAEAELAQQKADTEQQLASARAELEGHGDAVWYIQDRGGISSFSSVESDTASIEAIATVFPLIFFVVAALISSTTASRMVEEERTLIGLYKALGYRNGRILSKYVDYALWACLVGGVIGNLIGFIALPLFLFTVFKAMYTLPDMLLSYDILTSLGSVALFAVGVVGAAYLACRRELAETPAALMRPKAPRAGSRIFLERIGLVWRHLGFLNKVTARNLFRYKKRALMTILGIAGCTALIICGLGIRDTVSALSAKQYGKVTRYDVMAVANPDDLDAAVLAMQQRSDAAGEDGARVSGYATVMTDNVTFIAGGKSETVQMVVVPDDQAARIGDYVRLESEDGAKIALKPGKVVLSKSAQMVLGTRAGDTARVQDSSLSVADVTVSDISLNYLGNTMFVCRSTYEKAFGKTMRANGVLVNLAGGHAAEQRFCREIKADGWLTVVGTADLTENFEANFKIVDSVVVLVTFMAACLSFVVVFTLSYTNISERGRELATIKVLGFRRGEVHHYVNKETLVLTAIGAVLGMPLGYALARSFTYVLQMPSLYFDVEVRPVSYVIAVALAFAFTLIVNLATNRSLNKIDMVGALKSAE